MLDPSLSVTYLDRFLAGDVSLLWAVVQVEARLTRELERRLVSNS